MSFNKSRGGGVEVAQTRVTSALEYMSSKGGGGRVFRPSLMSFSNRNAFASFNKFSLFFIFVVASAALPQTVTTFFSIKYFASHKNPAAASFFNECSY